MIQAGIHPGESDGKDAGFIALRELLSRTAGPGSLEKISLLFVPAFNADGHERVGRWNRPNQNGPKYGLANDAREPQSQPRLRQGGYAGNAGDAGPDQHLGSADMRGFARDRRRGLRAGRFHSSGPVNQGDPQLRASGVRLRDELIEKLAQQGSLPLPFYPDLFETDNPRSGFVLTVYSPRFSTGYFRSATASRSWSRPTPGSLTRSACR